MNNFTKNLKTKSVIALICLFSITCLFFFMNCSVNEEPIIVTSGATTSSTTETSNPNATTTSSTTTSTEDCSNNPSTSRLDIVRDVAEETGDLYKTNVSQFTQKVAECLKEINENWGLYLDSSGVAGEGIVAYRMGENENPYSVDILKNETTSDPQLQWLEQGDSDECGRVGGTWQSVNEECVLGQIEEKCTQEQLDSGKYATANEKCLPKCSKFADSNAAGVEIATGEQCNDQANYNILYIQDTYEGNLEEPQACCRRSSKRSCPSGYHFTESNCQPSCAQAAKLAGFTQSHVYDNGGSNPFTTNTSDCDDLSAEGHKDWEDFTFYDSYRFLQKSNTETHIYEIQPDSDKYGCCRRGSQDATPAKAYDSKGWHDDDRD